LITLKSLVRLVVKIAVLGKEDEKKGSGCTARKEWKARERQAPECVH
jgi:hypothetical protein